MGFSETIAHLTVKKLLSSPIFWLIREKNKIVYFWPRSPVLVISISTLIQKLIFLPLGIQYDFSLMNLSTIWKKKLISIKYFSLKPIENTWSSPIHLFLPSAIFMLHCIKWSIPSLSFVLRKYYPYLYILTQRAMAHVRLQCLPTGMKQMPKISSEHGPSAFPTKCNIHLLLS